MFHPVAFPEQFVGVEVLTNSPNDSRLSEKLLGAFPWIKSFPKLLHV